MTSRAIVRGVTVTCTAYDRYEVKYGSQVTKHLDYAAACYELGKCVMHALTSDGLLDPPDAEYSI